MAYADGRIRPTVLRRDVPRAVPALELGRRGGATRTSRGARRGDLEPARGGSRRAARVTVNVPHTVGRRHTLDRLTQKPVMVLLSEIAAVNATRSTSGRPRRWPISGSGTEEGTTASPAAVEIISSVQLRRVSPSGDSSAARVEPMGGTALAPRGRLS